jgi:hypothetical protein
LLVADQPKFILSKKQLPLAHRRSTCILTVIGKKLLQRPAILHS